MFRKLAPAVVAAACLTAPAAAADLILIPPPPVVIEPELFSWTSCYVGLHLNYDKATTSERFPFSDYQTESTGPGIGGQLGCDFQLDDSPFVLGVVVDATAQNKTGSTDIPLTTPQQTLETSVPLVASIRGRAGVAADTTLFYATGGLALAHVSNTLTVGTGYEETASATHFGWTVGAGIETMLTDNISIFAEYLYADLGRQDYTFPGADFSGTGNPPIDTLAFDLIDHSIKVGVNWRF